MKKILLPISILLIAALACTWGGPSRGVPRVTKTSAPAVQAPEATAAPEVEAAATETVHIPNVTSGGETTTESVTETAPEGTAAPETGAPEAGAPLDPYVVVEASTTQLHAGETFTVTGTAVDVALPLFSLVIRDEGVQDALPAAQVSAEGVATALEGASQVVEFVSASGGDGKVVFVLRAKAAGITTISIIAAGETASGSGDVLISVAP